MVPVSDPLSIPRFLADRLRRGARAALLVVAAEEGRAPGAPGFMMAADGKGAQLGTLGGGAMERAMTESAHAALRGEGAPAAIRHFAHNADGGGRAEPSGMICGGGQTVVLYVCGPGDLAAIEAWQRGGTGRLTVTPRGIRFSEDPKPGEGARIRFLDAPDGWRYEERMAPPDTVHIIGGGHVGQALARILCTLPLRIEIVDPRPRAGGDLAREPAVRRLALDYAEGAARIPSGADRHVVIATPDHAADYESLRAVIRKDLRYLAVVGSPDKAKRFRERLRAEGLPEERAAQFRLPAGIPIGSRTPAEIAVSIAAEIIAVRNRPALPPGASGFGKNVPIRDGQFPLRRVGCSPAGVPAAKSAEPDRDPK